MKDMTFNDWKLLGYSVKKGEHSKKKDSCGNPLFTREQVEDSESRFTFDGHRIKSNFDETDVRELVEEIKPDFSEEDY